MSTAEKQTYFASPQIVDFEEIKKANSYIENKTLYKKAIDLMSDVFIILNEHRQVVYGNKTLFEMLGNPPVEEVLGMRPGELFHCQESGKGPNGCGTGKKCRECGAILTILESRKEPQKEKSNECRIIQGGTHKVLPLRVSAITDHFEGTLFTFVTLSDISPELQKKTLEQLFLHDISNIVGGVNGLCEVVPSVNDNEKYELLTIIRRSSQKLMDIISYQKQLISAEYGDLKVTSVPIELKEFCEDIVHLYDNHQVAKGKRVLFDVSPSLSITTDKNLLNRMVGNLIKNALEASEEGGVVTLGYSKKGFLVSLWVHNDGFIPVDSQKKIFEKSFSTKKYGNGLGTYSTKIFAEVYLHGGVSFKTSVENGTTFTIDLPLHYYSEE